MQLSLLRRIHDTSGGERGGEVKPIPISAAKRIAEQYGYDQVVVIARSVGEGEHVTTYGRGRANCDVAARIGEFLKFKVMGWVKQSVVEHSK